MNNIPPVLYRGTTLLRWKLAEKDGRIDAYNNGQDGYICFTTNTFGAEVFAIMRYVRDLLTDFEFKHYYDLRPHLRDSVIITIMTSDLMTSDLEDFKRNLEIDPEDNPLSRITQGFPQIGPETWYRHKGDIGLEYITDVNLVYRISDWEKHCIDVIVASKDMRREMDKMYIPLYQQEQLRTQFEDRYKMELEYIRNSFNLQFLYGARFTRGAR